MFMPKVGLKIIAFFSNSLLNFYENNLTIFYTCFKIMFIILFLKGRQLASLDKEAVCFDDQEDQCSGYSPSFFHFKPTTKNYKTALWGGMFSLTKTKSSTLAIYLAFCINQITNIVVTCLKTKILVFLCDWF